MKNFLPLILLCICSLLASYEIVHDLAQVPILTPSLSSRKTMKIRLDNGLEVYLISDPGCSQSAAALSVDVGSWHDPETYPGMAHFLEHMLFMGTQAYPDESEYSAFIRDHGGSENAFTSADRTLYVFSANNDALPLALERFSHFFIDPLFSSSCVERELHAVDEEFSLCIQEESWRKWMILKETGNPSHPNRAFCIGNLETLQGIPRAALEAWHQKNYQAHRMHLVIISALALDELTPLTEKLFSPIASEEQEETLAFSEPLLSEQQRGHLLYVVPLGNTSQLELTWEVPLKFARDQNRKAVELTAYALEQASERSLQQLLKKEHLAKSVNVSLDQISRDHLIFSLGALLTNTGLEEIDRVISLCFQAIARLKETGVPPYVYEEFETLSHAHYQYQSRESSFETALVHADNLVEEKLETHPEKGLFPSLYDPLFISEFIHTLNPETCVYILTADPTCIDIDNAAIEKWTGAEYSLTPISKENLIRWGSLLPHPEIDLPSPNPFLPHPILKEKTSSSATSFLIEASEGAQVYSVEDTHYLVPELIALFNFYSPLLDASANTEALLNLFFKNFFNSLEIPLAFAREAGMTYSFSHEKGKIYLEVQGFSDQVPLLLKEIFSHLSTLSLSEEDFEENKAILANYFDNPVGVLERAQEILTSALFADSVTKKEKVLALQSLTYDEFLAFNAALFQEVAIEGLFCGDITCEEAETLWSTLKMLLPSRALSVKEKKALHFPLEERGRKFFEEAHDEMGNAALLLLHQGSFSLERRAVQTILSKALEEAFFDALRTKQQTGYLVNSWNEVFEQELFQVFAVHSSHYEPRDLLARFDLFLQNFSTNLKEKIPQMRFETLRHHYSHLLNAPADNLFSYARKFFIFTFSQKEGSSDYERYIECLQSLTYERFLELAEEILQLDSASIAILISGT
jgi:insulysin